MSSSKKAFSYAFPLTIPIGVSFVFLGIGLGLYGISQGLPAWLPPVIALVVFAGSMEFVTVSLLLAPFDPIGAFILTLLINGRHIFYGLSLLEKYGDKGWKKWPLILGMCDESFAINVSTTLPDDVDKGWFYLHVPWLNYVYWSVGTLLGGVAGTLLSFINFKGIEFVLTALFLVIFLEMLLSATKVQPIYFGIAGVILAIIALLVVGKTASMLTAMFGMLVLCYIAYKWGGVRYD